MFVPISSDLNENAEDEYMINAALVAGLYPKILIAEGGNGLKTLGNNQAISIVSDIVRQVAFGTDYSFQKHPSSINFRTKVPDFGANHLVYYTIMQSRKVGSTFSALLQCH